MNVWTLQLSFLCTAAMHNVIICRNYTLRSHLKSLLKIHIKIEWRHSCRDRLNWNLIKGKSFNTATVVTWFCGQTLIVSLAISSASFTAPELTARVSITTTAVISVWKMTAVWQVLLIVRSALQAHTCKPNSTYFPQKRKCFKSHTALKQLHNVYNSNC